MTQVLLSNADPADLKELCGMIDRVLRPRSVASTRRRVKRTCLTYRNAHFTCVRCAFYARARSRQD